LTALRFGAPRRAASAAAARAALGRLRAPRRGAEPRRCAVAQASFGLETQSSERSGRGASPSRPHGAPAPDAGHLARWKSMEETDAERRRREDAARRAQLMRPSEEDFGPPHDDPDRCAAVTGG